jgi:hypothetical protein
MTDGRRQMAATSGSNGGAETKEGTAPLPLLEVLSRRALKRRQSKYISEYSCREAPW